LVLLSSLNRSYPCGTLRTSARISACNPKYDLNPALQRISTALIQHLRAGAKAAKRCVLTQNAGPRHAVTGKTFCSKRKPRRIGVNKAL